MKTRRHSTITECQVLQVFKWLRCATGRQLVMYFANGEGKRIKALETLLPKLEQESKLSVTWFRGEKVYSLARANKAQSVSLEHEVAVTEITIRIWRCRIEETEFVPERAFRGFAIVPECGFRYSEKRGTMLTPEVTTRQNFLHGSNPVKSKLTRYRSNLADIEAYMKRDITVLFIIDMPRQRIFDYIAKHQEILATPIVSGFSGKVQIPFYMTSYQTFVQVPLGKALHEPIYIWHDGKEYPLSHD